MNIFKSQKKSIFFIIFMMFAKKIKLVDYKSVFKVFKRTFPTTLGRACVCRADSSDAHCPARWLYAGRIDSRVAVDRPGIWFVSLYGSSSSRPKSWHSFLI